MPLLRLDNLPLFYIDRGRGPTLLLVHGAGGTWRHWGLQVRDLAALDRRVIALDLPGHGRSGGVPADALEEYVPILTTLLERLELQNVTLVGHSMGGAIALAAALERPARLDRVAVVGSGAKLRVHRSILRGFARDNGSAIISLIGEWSRAQGSPPHEVARVVAALRATPGPVYLADFQACQRFDLRDQIAALNLPLLVLCGTGDTMSPPKNSRELAAAVPTATLKWIDGAGHMVMLDQPEEVTSALYEFSRTDGGGPE